MYPVDTIGDLAPSSSPSPTGAGPGGLTWKMTLALAALGGAVALYSWPAYRAWERRSVGNRVGGALASVGVFLGLMQLAIAADTKHAIQPMPPVTPPLI